MPNTKIMPYGTDIEREILHDIRDGLGVKDFADECIWKTARMENCAIPLAKKGYRKQEWISVNDRLPETTIRCIVSKYNVPLLAYWDGEKWRETNKLTVVDGVTHWMPLPEPPKGE